MHARNQQRAAALDDLVARGADLVVGDLAQAEEVKELAEAVNSLGRMDAVIHNAGAANTRNQHTRGTRRRCFRSMSWPHTC